MSVVNKMLNDLDARAGLDDDEGAEYQEPPETKRIRYMIAFIVLVVLSAAGYFAYRAMGPEYFMDLYAQVKNTIEGKKPEVQETKQVSVNSALEQMMPTRSGNTASETATQAPQPEDEPEEPKVEMIASVEPSAMAGADDTMDAEAEDSAASESITSDAQEMASTEPESTEEPDLLPGGRVAPSPDLEPIPEEELSFVQLSDADEQDSVIAELSSTAADAVAANDVSQAIRIYRQILSIDLRNHDARKKLAVLHYSLNENGAASVVLNEGIQLEPERADFRLMLARLFYRQKKLKQAYAVLAQIEPDVQRNIDYFGLKATVAQELELNAESSHLYGRLVIFEPNRAQWWLGLAISLDRMGQRDGALRAYENAADLRQLSASADDFIRQRILELGG